MLDQPNTPTSDRRLFLVGGGAVLLIIVVAIAIVLFAGRTTNQYPADSALGAIQGYLAALEASDLEAAYAYFSDDVRDGFELSDYERSLHMYGTPYGDGSPPRVLFDHVSGSGDRVRVHVVVEYFYGGGIGGGGSYRSPQAIRMVLQADGWRIDERLVWLEPIHVHDSF